MNGCQSALPDDGRHARACASSDCLDSSLRRSASCLRCCSCCCLLLSTVGGGPIARLWRTMPPPSFHGGRPSTAEEETRGWRVRFDGSASGRLGSCLASLGARPGARHGARPPSSSDSSRSRAALAASPPNIPGAVGPREGGCDGGGGSPERHGSLGCHVLLGSGMNRAPFAPRCCGGSIFVGRSGHEKGSCSRHCGLLFWYSMSYARFQRA